MLMIRFQRIGRKNDPAFRMVVLEKASGPKAGTYVEQVGTYNPKTKAFTANAESIKGWIGKGAQVSPSLMNLLIEKGVLEGKKSAAVVKAKNLTKNVKAEEPAPEAAPAEDAQAETVEAAIAEAEDATEEAPAEAALAPEEEPAAAPAA